MKFMVIDPCIDLRNLLFSEFERQRWAFDLTMLLTRPWQNSVRKGKSNTTTNEGLSNSLTSQTRFHC
jgi:hypothetical protein